MEQLKQPFVNAGPISKVALGTMRFADKNCSVSEVEELITVLYEEAGVNVHHSSYEYSSYALYTEALARFKKKRKPASSISVSCQHLISKNQHFLLRC
jgi:predicted oxidoreductase